MGKPIQGMTMDQASTQRSRIDAFLEVDASEEVLDADLAGLRDLSGDLDCPGVDAHLVGVAGGVVLVRAELVEVVVFRGEALGRCFLANRGPRCELSLFEPGTRQRQRRTGGDAGATGKRPRHEPAARAIGRLRRDFGRPHVCRRWHLNQHSLFPPLPGRGPTPPALPSAPVVPNLDCGATDALRGPTAHSR